MCEETVSASFILDQHALCMLSSAVAADSEMMPTTRVIQSCKLAPAINIDAAERHRRRNVKRPKHSYKFRRRLVIHSQTGRCAGKGRAEDHPRTGVWLTHSVS